MQSSTALRIGKLHTNKLALTGLLVLALIAWLFPFYLLVITSFKSGTEMVSGPLALPKALDFSAYVQAWNLLGLGGQLRNTFVYAFLGSFLALALASIPAYALGKFKIPGGRVIFVVLLSGMMLPQQIVVIPLFDLLASMKLSDTILGLILVHGVYGMPFILLILRGFVENIPSELEDAARVDGASDFGILRHVIFPLVAPGAAISFTLNFMDIWREFFFALVFLNSETNFPISLSMLKVTAPEFFTTWNIPAATAIIAQLPLVILYVFAYRWITEGVFAGAIKGG